MSRCYCNCCPEYIKSTQYNFRGWLGVKAWESTAGAMRFQVAAKTLTKMTTTTTTRQTTTAAGGKWFWTRRLDLGQTKIYTIGRFLFAGGQKWENNLRGEMRWVFRVPQINHRSLTYSDQSSRDEERISLPDRETLRGHLASSPSSAWTNEQLCRRRSKIYLRFP